MKKIVISLLFCFSVSAYAGSETFTIDYVGIEPSIGRNMLFVGVTTLPTTAPPSCTSKQFRWDLSTGKEMYSLILSAQARGKNIKINVDSTNCILGSPTGIWTLAY